MVARLFPQVRIVMNYCCFPYLGITRVRELDIDPTY